MQTSTNCLLLNRFKIPNLAIQLLIILLLRRASGGGVKVAVMAVIQHVCEHGIHPMGPPIPMDVVRLKDVSTHAYLAREGLTSSRSGM
jgi:hypothetical protein